MKGQLLVANWKMNPRTAHEAETIFLDIKKNVARLKNTHIVVCPPSIFLGDIQPLYKGDKISFGAQEVFYETEGSFTGQLSVDQLQDSGVSYVLVGHSEQRVLGETNTDTNKKIGVLFRHAMTPILCVGETKRDNEGDYLAFITEQIQEGLKGVSVKEIKNIVIAYEPVWAIGKKEDDAMTSHELHQMSLFIRKIITHIFDAKAASGMRLLYGGSVKRGNAADLFKEGAIQGFLVGSASLDPDHFSDIARIMETIK